jgi:hypothetical protein
VNINKNLLREKIFYFVLLSYVAFLPFSEALVSIAAGMLLLQAIVLKSWKHPSVLKGNFLTLIKISSIFVVYLIGTTLTKDISFAFYELRKVVFWIIIPVSFFISPRLTFNRFLNVLTFFCLAVFVASIIATIKLVFKEYFLITGFRDITMVSHIRYSFQIVLSIIIAIYFLVSGGNKLQFIHNKTVIVFFLIWMTSFLVILKSITGLFAFFGTAFILLILLITRLKNIKTKIILGFLLILFVLSPIYYVNKVWNDFYNLEKLSPQKTEKFTPLGNPYFFDFLSLEKENGHWVKAYICETEIRNGWNKLSEIKYDSIDANGYAISNTLIRYLTSKGLRKDDSGVSKLSERDVKAIENGIANYIYVDKSFSIYPRIYETIWEFDRYIETGNPNFQSFSQRIEYIKASFQLIKKNFWFGFGTGNWKIKYDEIYQEMNSKLLPENRGPSHNQYLNYFVKFGFLGFIYIFSMLIIPVFREGHKKNLIFWLFLVSMAIANFGDANFETHMGLSFFCFFYCFFLWNTPKEIRAFRF